MEILFLIISNSNYFMEIQNKQEEFLTLKNFKVHNTEFTDVCAQLVTSNGKIYVGLQCKSYFENKNNPRLKSILIPIEAWTTFVTQAIPTLDKAIKEHHKTHPQAPPATPKGRKRPYANGMFTLTFLTLIHTFLLSVSIIEYRFSKSQIIFLCHNYIYFISYDRKSPTTRSRRHGRRDSGGISGAELMELLNSIPEVPLIYPTATTIPAPDFLSALNSRNTSTRPQTLRLNPDTLEHSGLATTSASPYHLATLTTRPMPKGSTRCLRPSTPGSTAFPLPREPSQTHRY